MKSPLLRLEGVHVSVPAEPEPLSILHDITLDFEPGRRTAIIGPSGSGKTTLMMVCAGLMPPQRGRVLFHGAALSRDEEELTRWRQQNVGIVFQHFHLLPTSSALENVMLPLELAGAADARGEASELLSSVGLEHRLDHLPAQLSGGEQQRVALARAMARKPALLLADEPTGNLDQETGRRVIELLFARAAEFGTTLILVTHDESIAAQCDRIVSLRDGKVL